MTSKGAIGTTRCSAKRGPLGEGSGPLMRVALPGPGARSRWVYPNGSIPNPVRRLQRQAPELPADHEGCKYLGRLDCPCAAILSGSGKVGR
jgi:hypothetical protein